MGARGKGRGDENLDERFAVGDLDVDDGGDDIVGAVGELTTPAGGNIIVYALSEGFEPPEVGELGNKLILAG